MTPVICSIDTVLMLNIYFVYQYNNNVTKFLMTILYQHPGLDPISYSKHNTQGLTTNGLISTAIQNVILKELLAKS